MFLALWEYEVKPGCQERFQKAYGQQGDWAKLFRNDPNYRETRCCVMQAAKPFTSLWISGIREETRTVYGDPCC